MTLTAWLDAEPPVMVTVALPQIGTSSTSSTGQIQVISTGSYAVNASVGAGDVANIVKDDQVMITPSGSTTLAFGLVTSVGIVASSSSGSVGFPAVISVTGQPSGLYAGSTANVSIIYRQLSNVLVRPPWRRHVDRRTWPGSTSFQHGS